VIRGRQNVELPVFNIIIQGLYAQKGSQIISYQTATLASLFKSSIKTLEKRTVGATIEPATIAGAISLDNSLPKTAPQKLLSPKQKSGKNSIDSTTLQII
jgi:hypothetical protein